MDLITSVPAGCIVKAGNELGEGCTWSVARDALLWTDIEGRALWEHRPATGATRQWPLPERAGSFALTADAEVLLIALEHSLARLDLRTGATRTLVEFDHGLTTRSNDGRCDRSGNFVFGTLDEPRTGAPQGSWYRFSTAGQLQRLALPAVGIPNGLAFSADGRRIFYCDTIDRTVRTARYDAETGAITDTRVFSAPGNVEGNPDGATVDAADHYWSARWGAGLLVRHAPDGRVVQQVTVAAGQPACVALGGAGLRTLFATTAHVGYSAEQRAADPMAGHVFATDVAVAGLPEPLYAGSLG